MVYGWGDAPGYRMAWAVGAGGASSDYWYGEGFWNTALFPEGDVFVGGLMESDEYVFGAGTDDETWVDGIDQGEVFVARYTSGGVPSWVSPILAWEMGISDVESVGDGSMAAWGVGYHGGEPVVFGAGGPGEISIDAGECCCFLARYLGDGTPDWVTYSSGPSCVARENGLSRAPNGDFCVSGTYRDDGPPLELIDGENDTFVLSKTGEGTQSFVARFDGAGAVEWARNIRYGGGDATGDIAPAVALQDGSCAFLGWYRKQVWLQDGSGGEETVVSAPWAIWGQYLVKYGSDGDLDWARDVGVAGAGSGTASGLPRLLELEGDIIVSSAFNGEMMAGTESDPYYQSAGQDQEDRGLYLARFDGASGDRVFVSLILGETSDRPYDCASALAALPDGGILMGGGFTGRKTFGACEERETELVATGPDTDAFLAAYDPDGTLRWASRVASWPNLKAADGWGFHGEIVRGVSVDEHGSIFAVGSFVGEAATFGTGPDDAIELASLGSYDAFLFRMDPIDPPD